MALSIRRSHKLAVAAIVAAILGLFLTLQPARGAGVVMTDKSDYFAGEVAVISGGGFDANTGYDVPVIRPDGTIVTGEGISLPGWDSVITDANGAFTYPYVVLPGMMGSFEVRVYLSPWSGDRAEAPLASTTFTDANESANLDQCANDPLPSPSSDGCNSDAAQWVNGNLGASKSVYYEGDSIPYRMRFGNLSTSSIVHTVTIEWDTTKGGKHAIDYLTTFNQSVLDANPCLGVSSCNPAIFDTEAIPADPQVTGGGVTPIAGVFTLYGGAITGVSAYTYSNGTGFTGDKSARLTISFTASVADPVLAWGGHIATRHDWGMDNSAVAIPGSPYHTRLIDLDGAGGNQDRSLSADAVIFPGSITIIKDATPNGSTFFSFTASPAPLANFSLVDDGTSANTEAFSNIIDFQTYTVTESTPPAGWTFTGVTCSVASANGGTQAVNGSTATINLKEGEEVTCTYSNQQTAKDLTVSKTATAAFTRTYSWDINKAVDKTQVNIPEGGSATFNYTVGVTHSSVDSGWTVSGTITVSNPNYFDVAGVNIADSIDNGGTCTVTGGANVTVPANSSVDASYSCSFASAPGSGTNTATATWDKATYGTPNGSASGTKGYDFSSVTPTIVNGTITVVDNKTDPLKPVTLGTASYTQASPIEFTYSLSKAGVAGSCKEYTNTAIIEGTAKTASQTVKVCVGKDLTVTKTAAGTFDRTYLWQLGKAVDKTTVNIPDGGSATFNYSVQVDQTGISDTAWTLAGTITISNPNNWQDITPTGLSDSVDNGGTCTVAAGPYVIPKSGSLDVAYSCSYASQPSSYSGTNTATAEWDKAAAFTPNGSVSGEAGFTQSQLGSTNKTVTVTDSLGGALGSVTATDSAPFASTAFTYSKTFSGVGAACTKYDNTATITETGQSADKSVTVCVGKDLTVTKTAAGTLDRTYKWLIDKSVDQTEIDVAGAGLATFNYSVKVTPDGYTDSGWTLGGTITVTNPNDWEDVTVDVADTLDSGGTCSITEAAPYVAPKGGSLTLHYTCTTDGTSAKNTATVTWDKTAFFTPGGTASGDADVTFPIDQETNKVITVVDDKTDPLNPVTLGSSNYFAGPFEFTYSLAKPGVAGDCVDYTNIAVIDETDQSDSQTVRVCGGMDLTVEKTAALSFTRTYQWAVDKSVDKTQVNIAADGTATFNYTVDVTHDSGTDSAWVLAGTITVHNPNDWEAITANITDAFPGGACTVAGGTGVSVPAGQSVTLNYSCSFSSQPPYSGTNTATATWDAAAASTPGGSASGQASFKQADPTTRVDGSMTVTDSLGGVLGTVTYLDPSPKSFTYSYSFIGDPAGTCTGHDNTATFTTSTTGTTGSASQTVTVCVGKDLTVEKTAAGTFDRTYLWKITKAVDQTQVNIAAGGSYTFKYTVTAEQTGITDSGWQLAGIITIRNPNDWEDITLTNLSDVVDNGGACTVAAGPYVVPRSGSLDVSYSCSYASQPSSYSGTNTATATWDKAATFTPGDSATGSAPFSLSQLGSTNRTTHVTDSYAGDLGTVTATDSAPFAKGTFTYDRTESGVAGKCTKYDNTATITETGQTVGQQVTLCVGADLRVSKTAAGTFDRTYNWLIDKSVDQTQINIPEGGTATFNYTVKVTPNGFVDSGWTLSGTITVTNPNDWEAITADVSDSFDGGGVCSVSGGIGAVIPAGQSVTLDYSCTFSSEPKYAGKNTATATWDKTTYFTPTGSASGEADATLTLKGETNRVITVVDDKTDPLIPVTLDTSDYYAGPFVFTYSLDKQGVPGACTDYTNTAVIDETGQSDFQTVTVCVGKDLTVSKTAIPSFTRTWNWTITKDYDATYNLFAGQSVTHGYKVTVTPNSIDSAWQVVGTITINNPNNWEAIVANVSDAVDNGGTCTVDQASVSVPANGSAEVGYSCTWEVQPPSYDSVTNTATVTWDRTTASTPGGTASGVHHFGFKNPTEVNPIVSVDDDNLSGEAWSADRAYSEWTYTKDFACSSNPADYIAGTYSYSHTNVAKINETPQIDTATVNVNCYAPVISKTAAGTYDERHEWDVTKTVSPVSQSAFAGDTVSYEWTVVVTEQTFEENFKVAGEITVVNPAPMEMTVDLVDALGGGTPGAIGACTNGTFADGKLTVPGGATAVCAYSAAPGGRTDTVNNATVTLNGIAFPASANFGWAANVIRGSVSLDDDQNPAFPQTISDGGTWTYSEQYTCSTAPEAYDASTHRYSFGESNTATVTSGEFSDSSGASTSVDCYVPLISKDASGTYDEVHDWEVFKSVNTASQTAFAGEKKNFTWTVRVDETTHGENYAVAGKITVVNPNPEDALTVGLSDALNDGSVATIGPCTGGTWASPNLTVPAGGTATCDYSVTPKGDMNAFNGALPAQVTMSVKYPFNGGPAYFPITNVTGGGALNGTYEGWCVDTAHTIYENTNYTANVYSSYEQLPAGLVDFPQNFDLVNWIINQDFVGKPAGGSLGNYTYSDVQYAIWTLIDNQVSTSGLYNLNTARAAQIVAAAQANGEGFTPTCGDFIAVVLQPVGGQQSITIAQVTFASLGIDCATSNAVTAVLNGVSFPASAEILWTATKVNETAALDDDQKLDWPTTVSGDTTFSYLDPQGYTCSSDPDDYTNGFYQYNESNTAVLTFQTGSDTATASTAVKCYAPIVSKTAAGTYDQRHEWDVEKTVSPPGQDVLAGGTGYFQWTVTVTESVFEENFVAAGTISVKNPRPDDGNMVVKLTDVLSDSSDATITGCSGGTWNATNQTVAIPPNTTALCSYTAALNYSDVANAPNANTVRAELMVGTTHLSTTAVDALEWTPNVIRGSATLDDYQNPAFPMTLTDGGAWTYEDSYTCSTQQGDYTNGSYTYTEPNLATLDTGDSSSATETVNCHAPVVTKDVTTYFNRHWDWTITKDSDATYDMFEGESKTHGYKVTVSPTPIDSLWGAKGSITISNSHPEMDMVLTSVSDLAGGITGAVACPSLIVPSLDSLTCTYDTGAQNSPDLNPFGTTNTATAVFGGGNWTGTAPITFSADPTTEDNPVVTADDSNLTGESWSADRAYGEWTYTRDFPCSTNPDDYTGGTYSYSLSNTAKINETGQTDTANVNVNCYWPANAKVTKVTVEGAEDIGQFPFNFELYDPSGAKVETKTLSAAGDVSFEAELKPEGTWKIVEVLPEGWISTDASLECSFTVDYWADAGRTFTCTFNNTEMSRAKLLKWTQGVIDPSRNWTFNLYEGAHAFGGSSLGSGNALNDPDGILDFGNVNLSKFEAYTLCELSVPAGWTTFWQVDSNGDGDIDIDDAIVIPYNPNASDNPPQNLGNLCVDFGAGTGVDLLSAGKSLLFMVNNTYPGGDPRTPGYWKNWNRVTGGGQDENADHNGGYLNGFWLLEDVLNPSIGGGVTWDDILANDTWTWQILKAEVGVDILDQRAIGSEDVVGDGAKHSSDAAYTLAMHLMAAQLNFGAGARTCDAAQDAALAAEQLLDKYNFNGTKDYLLNNNKQTKADYNLAIQLAATLDQYNNGVLCSGPAVWFVAPLNGDTIVGSKTIVVEAMDQVPVVQVEFFVDGVSIGVDTVKSDGWSIPWDSTSVADGVRTLSARATNSLAQVGAGDVVVTIDNVADVALPAMHVGDLSATTKAAKAGKWNATATVTVHDASHGGVAGAVVTMTWSDGTTATCTTGATGTCSVSRNNIGSAVSSLTLEVTDIALSGSVYDPALNEKTSITVNKP